MKTIHKAAVPASELNDVITVNMPTDAVILSVGNQRESLCFWYETNTGLHHRDTVPIRHFRVAGTGHPLDVGLPLGRFLGTVQFAGGKLVFHVYEEKR